jgi:signal transduction histidine kinase
MFAPAERESDELIQKQAVAVGDIVLLPEMFDAVPDFLLVLNSMRQIVFANRAMRSFVEESGNGSPLGLRPGEVLKCIHAFETEGGCGTTEFCRNCGAVRAVLNSQGGKQDIQECRISREPVADSLDLRIMATPFSVGGEEVTIVAAEDISSEKRRSALERTFFHDILNTAGGLQGLIELADHSGEGEAAELHGMIQQQVGRLVEEITAQRQLLAAENDRLAIKVTPVESFELLNAVADLYRNHEAAAGKEIEIHTNAVVIKLNTDRTLLSRVLGNMVKNALEASEEGQTITLGSLQISDGVLFWVHNPVFMPRDVQLQVFQRSFTTKGEGRGIGTYSIKLFGERYLKGTVDFNSSEEKGTTFEIRLPLNLTSE